jgi:hypothetical protein
MGSWYAAHSEFGRVQCSGCRELRILLFLLLQGAGWPASCRANTKLSWVHAALGCCCCWWVARSQTFVVLKDVHHAARRVLCCS